MLHLLDASTAEAAGTMSEPQARQLAGKVVVRRVEAAKQGFTQQTVERWTLIGCGVIVFLVAVVLVFRLQTQVDVPRVRWVWAAGIVMTSPIPGRRFRWSESFPHRSCSPLASKLDNIATETPKGMPWA